MAIQLGDKVKDRVTGFTGIVISRTEWLNGCIRIGIQPQELKDGKSIEAEWYDAQQVEILESGAIVLTPQTNPEPAAKKGGPQRDPKY
jgi:hypothetical protein